jgi:hypothetical protein
MDAQACLQDLYFLLLYGGVIMLNLVAALYLLHRRGNAFAPEITSPVKLRRWASAFLLADAFSHAIWFMGVRYPLAGNPEVSNAVCCCADVIIFLPTMAGTLLAMLQDRKRPVWPVAVAVLPVVVVLVITLVLGINAFLVPISVYAILLFSGFSAYLVIAVRRYGRWLRDNYADLEHKEISRSIIALVVFMLFVFLYSVSESMVTVYSLQVDSIVIVGMLLWRVETIQQLSVKEEVQPVRQQPNIPASIGPLLRRHCEDAGLYLQQDLTLSQLAQAIGTNRYYLSQFFAGQGLTYNAYINGLRIRHFVRLYHESVAQSRIFTAQELSRESGFRSYSTFGDVLKQSMGKTVTAWMREGKE